jgi:hypothetical protein
MRGTGSTWQGVSRRAAFSASNNVVAAPQDAR